MNIVRMRNMEKKHSQILLNFLKELLEEQIEMRRLSYSDIDKMMRDYNSLRKIVRKYELPIKVSMSKKDIEIWLFHWTKKDEGDAKKDGLDFDDLDKIDIEIVDE
jgi:hypothetical protein